MRLMRRPNRYLCGFAMLVGLAVTAFAVASPGEPTPHEARVRTAGAAVRSGPAEGYYLTDTLPEGSTVEVYQQRPDGWCAIRPPESSFSWVFAQHVEPVGDGLGKITKDDVAARVGSRLTSQRDVAQVRLRKDEIVQVIDEGSYDGRTWYKIAPPSGEFRWIHVRNLQSDAAVDGLAARSVPAWRPTTLPERQVEAMASRAEKDDVHLASTDEEADSADGTEPSPSATAADQPRPSTEQPISAGAAPQAEFGRRVAELELRLSRMVAEPHYTWDLGRLEGDAGQLLSQASTVEQRKAIQGTIGKIDRFAAIHRRRVQASGNASGLASNQNAATGIAPVATPAAQPGSTAANEAGRFDAVGVLRPVVSRRTGAPQFALVDEHGRVVSFVTPTPDVNLQPYLGRRIGVVGTRGYMPEFQRPYVTAGRVSPLGQSIVR